MKVPEEIEKHRVKTGIYASPTGKTYGFFYIPFRSSKMTVMVCDGQKSGWDHVSVSLKNRCPNWEEMCFVKDLFWDPEECVVQYHPARSEHISMHPYCLHMWKPLNQELPKPDLLIVGWK